MCGWQKMTLVRFCKKLRFSVRFPFYKINCSFGFLVRLGLHSSVDVDAVFYLHLYGMMLEMMCFRAELVQLIVSWNDSELEMQTYGMKKNTLTVDPIMLQDKLWIRQHEKPSPNRRNRVFGFWILKLVRFLENRYATFSLGSAHTCNMDNIIQTLPHITTT